MNRNLKADLKSLSLAFVLVLAVSALTASPASATDFFTTTKEKAWLTGTSTDNVMEISGKKYECTTSKLTATVTNGASQITALPSYTGTKNIVPHSTHCSSSVGNMTFDVNHCAYVFTGDTTGSDNGVDATVWIECPEGSKIQTTSSLGLTISIPAQTPTEGGVTYTDLANHPGGPALKIAMTMTGITSTCAPAFTCGLGGIATHGNTSKITGTMDITAFEDLGGTLTAPIEVKQIPVEWS